MKHRQAFTLIELLIVVAIIAILAAIAVPNFLEAQVRAKVARVKNDLRAVIVAEEAYMLDWNTYTFREWNMQTSTYSEGLRVLTSPVSYIAGVSFDSFGSYADSARYWSKPKFEFHPGSAGRRKSCWCDLPSRIRPICSQPTRASSSRPGNFPNAATTRWRGPRTVRTDSTNNHDSYTTPFFFRRLRFKNISAPFTATSLYPKGPQPRKRVVSTTRPFRKPA